MDYTALDNSFFPTDSTRGLLKINFEEYIYIEEATLELPDKLKKNIIY